MGNSINVPLGELDGAGGLSVSLDELEQAQPKRKRTTFEDVYGQPPHPARVENPFGIETAIPAPRPLPTEAAARVTEPQIELAPPEHPQPPSPYWEQEHAARQRDIERLNEKEQRQQEQARRQREREEEIRRLPFEQRLTQSLVAPGTTLDTILRQQTPAEPAPQFESDYFRHRAEEAARAGKSVWDDLPHSITETMVRTANRRLTAGQARQIAEPFTAPLIDVPTATGETEPFVVGAERAIGGFTSPENIALLASLGELSAVAKSGAGLVRHAPRVISGLFATQMGVGLVEAAREYQAARAAGDVEAAQRILGSAAVQAPLTLLATYHATLGGRGARVDAERLVEDVHAADVASRTADLRAAVPAAERTEGAAARPTVTVPLDELKPAAAPRPAEGVTASLFDLEPVAPESKSVEVLRRTMADERLPEPVREAARAELERATTAPVEGTAPALAPRFEVTPPEPRTLEKAEVADYGRQQAQLYTNRLRNPIEREYAQSYLRARLEGGQEPERIASLAADRARIIASNVESYIERQKIEPLEKRFAPDVLEEAQQELRAAHELASSFDKPGRFPVGPEDALRSSDRDAWMGVSSSRHIVAEQFPWYADESLTPAKLEDAIRRGAGANYERVVSRIADHIQAQREEAAPVLEEFGPQLRDLADQVREVDPDLAQTLTDLAEGKYSGVRNFRRYVEEKITDAAAAAQFSRDFDAIATEEGRNAVPEGAEKFAGSRGRVREEGGRTEAPPGELAPLDVPLAELTPLRQPRAAPRAEEQPALPGMAGAIEEQSQAALREQARQAEEQISRPPESIEEAAGRMEREAPLFRGTEASPQEEIFREKSAEHPLRRQAEAYLENVDRIKAAEKKAKGAEAMSDAAWRASTRLELDRAFKAEGRSGELFGDFLQRVAGRPDLKPKGEEFAADYPQLRGGEELYAGLPIFDPQLIRRVMPEAIKNALGETVSVRQREAGIIREKTGELARRKERIFQQYANAMARWEKRPVEEGRAFILREQHGERQPSAEDQAVADQLQREFAARRRIVENLTHGSFDHWRENYFPQMWERPNQVAEWVRGRIFGAKRPLQGPAGFRKARVFEDLQEGLDAGFKPVTNNPVTMALLKLHEMDRYGMAHEILGESLKDGLAKFVRFGEKPPEGWQRVNDSMFRVMHYSEEAKGMVARGEYWMPADAARVLNNHLSPGLRGNTLYDVFRQAGNTLNQAQLGMSAFHLGFTSLDASVSDMALAIERFSRGEVLRGLKPAVRSLTVLGSPINTILRGNKLLKEYLEPGRYAEMTKLADAVAQAGGRVYMDPFYKNSAIESFWRAWQLGEYGKAGLRAFPAVLEWAAKPVMEVVVPRQKLGVFANLAEDVLRRADRESWSLERRRYELNRAWDSVDNRMGQLVYDNLFWNRAVKDLGLVSVRSLGWNLGTIREIAGGGVDFAKQLGRLSLGERAQVTHRMAYVAALPIVVGFTGAMIHYLSTGKTPETLTDYFFPQTGRLDADGRPERLSLPSYVKDLFHYAKEPVRTVVNKAHPLITMIVDMLQNRDFYGVEIRHPDDSLVRQAAQLAGFVAEQFAPFSWRNISQRARAQGRRGLVGAAREVLTPAGLESFIGITPAPKYVGRTGAEEKAIELLERRRPRGTRTSEEFERGLTRSYLRSELASGRMKPGQLPEHVRAGEITGADIARLLKASKEPPIVRYSRSLPLEDFLEVWDEASTDERKVLRQLLLGKRHLVADYPPERRKEIFDRVSKALNEGGAGGAASPR